MRCSSLFDSCGLCCCFVVAFSAVAVLFRLILTFVFTFNLRCKLIVQLITLNGTFKSIDLYMAATDERSINLFASFFFLTFSFTCWNSKCQLNFNNNDRFTKDVFLSFLFQFSIECHLFVEITDWNIGVFVRRVLCRRSDKIHWNVLFESKILSLRIAAMEDACVCTECSYLIECRAVCVFRVFDFACSINWLFLDEIFLCRSFYTAHNSD